MVEPHSFTGQLTPDELIDIGKHFLKLAESIKETVNEQDHQHTISHTSEIIDQLLPRQKLILYDLRAHAYAMQGQPSTAINDAQQMITLSPTLGAGYLRKASVFSMYGNQAQAIAAFEEGLQHASTDVNDYTEQLITEKTAASNAKERRIDLMTLFPAEVTDDIIARLPQDAKAVCLLVSRLWRKKLLGCAAAWENLSISDNNNEIQILGVVPGYIGHLVRHLMIDTATANITPVCFRLMNEGCFSRIDSLKISDTTARGLAPYVGRLLIALSQMSKTLATLDLDLAQNDETFSPSILLTDILSACRNLKNLTYSTSSPLAKLAGDFNTAEQHKTLINMQLKASSITRPDIEFMLQKCQKLRRFVINGCNATVLDAVNSHSTNLEIFAYNPSFTIPQLQGDISNDETGLRQIYTGNYDDVPATHLLPLIYKNRTTLETVHALMSPITNEEELQSLYAAYPFFKLKRVTKLAFWGLRGIQKFMLQAIRNTTTLFDLTVTFAYDVNELVEAILKLPSLKIVKLSNIRQSIGSSSWITLFESYGDISHSRPSLQCASLQYCDGITDAELVALSGIKSLHEITLDRLLHVSANGISTLIQNLSSQLTSVQLIDMDVVDDSALVALGDLKRMTYIKLDLLDSITDQGIRRMVDKACCPTTTLTKLVVTRCDLITSACIEYASQQIKVQWTPAFFKAAIPEHS
ncbi:hypothetical protein BDB00DRAFT_871494 [Zychaea mexicana]|uniref:uncharacterized protein n=1 Tax=Zychaea mexicana TaxID=64656 RepID=UPI0022FE4C4E|nr:uncharacterized protein BDB00DRAFT_871494 [Zychaea mexicana]KAI9494404.1 hypothetical protein BDB00DRAFT_871494 [Zychaea mexicana]